MSILLLNAGSSSLKATLMEETGDLIRVNALADWAGSKTHYNYNGRVTDVSWKGHAAAVDHLLRDMPESLRLTLVAVGHRVVHGGSFTRSVRISQEIQARIASLVELAPLHNTASLETLAAAQQLLPQLPHVAVFDTAFHAMLSPEAFTYPLPHVWTTEWGIRRYGFHGLSHAYCAGRAAVLLGTRPSRRLVICHLGHGCSATAVRDGRSIDTTMGFTPLDGLMMGTRSGAIDPGIALHVQQQHGLTAAEVDAALNRQAGLLGVSGLSADMRELLEASQADHAPASLAIAVYCHRVRQAIGALAATLGGIDALVFTAGVGEHASVIRAQICEGLDFLGLRLDLQANQSARPDCDIARPGSPGRILVIATREDLTMLQEVQQVLA